MNTALHYEELFYFDYKSNMFCTNHLLLKMRQETRINLGHLERWMAKCEAFTKADKRTNRELTGEDKDNTVSV